MSLISPNFAVKSIIFPNFAQGPFPKLLGKVLPKCMFNLVDKKIIPISLKNISIGTSPVVKSAYQRDGSFEHPKHMLKLMGKKIFTIVR